MSSCPSEHSMETSSEVDDQVSKKWYGVAATYKAIHVGKTRKRHLWERVVFLVRAADESDAMDVAALVAREKEQEYPTAGGDIVRWVFHEIEGIRETFDTEICDGFEVYWDFYERVDKQIAVAKTSS